MQKLAKYILVGLTIILILFVLWYFQNLVTYILISAVLSLMGRPLIDFLDKIRLGKFKIPRALSASVTLILIWVLIFTFFRVFLPIIANQANELSQIDPQSLLDSVSGPLDQLENILLMLNIQDGQNFSIDEFFKSKLNEIINVSILSNIFNSLATLLENLFIAVFSISFITFFFLKDEYLFREGIMLMVPLKHEMAVRKVFSSIKRLLTRYFIGLSVQISLIILLVTTGMVLVGIKFENALIIGLFAGLMNIIPYVGPLIGAFVGLILGVATSIAASPFSPIFPIVVYILIVFAIVQTIDNVFFQPLIYASSVNAHPLEIFLVLSIAGSVAGIPGMILAIPGYTMFRVFAKEFFNNFKVIQKLTEKI
jgi:predicted PurR-regulated permease PerM